MKLYIVESTLWMFILVENYHFSFINILMSFNLLYLYHIYIFIKFVKILKKPILS